jgi:hypothetical protein
LWSFFWTTFATSICGSTINYPPAEKSEIRIYWLILRSFVELNTKVGAKRVYTVLNE